MKHPFSFSFFFQSKFIKKAGVSAPFSALLIAEIPPISVLHHPGHAVKHCCSSFSMVTKTHLVYAFNKAFVTE